jgi:hypothetical protein
MDKKKSYSSSGCLLTGLALLFLILGVAEGMIGEGIELYWLKQRGVATSGTVTERRIEEGALGKHAHYVTYRFDAETGDSIQQITKEESVSLDTYESLHKDASVSVVYLPDNPDVGTIQDINHSLRITVIWATVTLGSLGLGAFSLLHYGLGQSITVLGTSLIVMGLTGFVGSFFRNGEQVGPTRPAYALMAVLGIAIMVIGVGLMTIKRQKENLAVQQMEHHSNDTYATNSLHLELSLKKLSVLLPELTKHRGAFSKIARRVTGKRDMLAVLEEHIRFGDSQPAVVISIEPLLVAAYTEDIDCVAILRFPAQLVSEYGLQVKSRLVTINTYMQRKEYQSDLIPGPDVGNTWTGFHPVIADFVSDDIETIESRKRGLAPQLWDYVYNLGIEHTKAYPGIWRDGRPFFSSKVSAS